MELPLAISPPELQQTRMCSRGCGARAKAKGLCHTCGEYERRTGQPRPDHLIVAQGRRILERRFLAQALRV